MKVIYFLLKGSYKQITIAAIISITSALMYILAIRSFNDILQFSKEGVINDFVLMVIAVLCSSVLAVIASHYANNHFEFKISGHRISLSELVLKSNYFEIEKNREVIIPILFNDIIAIGNFAKSLPDFIVSFFTILAIWAYMLVISWKFTLIFIAVVGVAIGIFLASQPYLFKEEKKAISQRNILHRRLHGLVDGLKELTLNTKHKRVYSQELIGPASNRHAKHNVNKNRVIIAVGKISESFILISLGGIVLISIFYFGLDRDFFIEFFAMVTFALSPLIRIGTFFSSLKKTEVALQQIKSLDVMLNSIEVVNDQVDAEIIPSEEHNIDIVISLRGLYYEYIADGETIFTVGPFNLDIHKNEILIVNGGNGAGKTTLIKMLTGLYQPSKGEIFYRGNKIDDKNLEAYRNTFSAVFADSFVFQDLRYIKHDRVNELIEKYLDMLEIRDKVSLDDGIKLSTTSLSMGQMSRLNLFRTLLEDKSIYVFDEWAANQDPYFKAKFYNEILPQLKRSGKTVIVISHDDRYYHVADRRVTVSQRSLNLS
ncbi:MAG: cyclic peptide export ABC transporter [Ekhidna sp.]|nr:cyclic peptide export ABC transporter [Ekhidna sp.]